MTASPRGRCSPTSHPCDLPGSTASARSGARPSVASSPTPTASPSSACASAACTPRTARCPRASSRCGAASATSRGSSCDVSRPRPPCATKSCSATLATSGATEISSTRAPSSAGSPWTPRKTIADPPPDHLNTRRRAHGSADPVSLHRVHGRRAHQGGALQRGLRHRARAAPAQGARRHLRGAPQENHTHHDHRRREKDDRGGERADLLGDLRGGEPRRADQRGVGRRRRPGALAGTGAPLHQESPARALPAHPAVAVAAARYRLGLGRRVVNRIVRALLRLGWGPAATYLLVVPGRRSGALRSTPVTLVEEGGRRWLVAPYGEVAWVRNVRAAGKARLARGARSEAIVTREVSAEEAAPVLKMYVTRVPITRPYFDVTPASDLGAFRAEAPRHPVFAIITTSQGTART